MISGPTGASPVPGGRTTTPSPLVSLVAGALVALACMGLWPLSADAHPAPQLVISQVYGGGGNAGAPFQNDFIEVFDRSGSAADVTGYSVQYATAAGGAWLVTPLSGSLAIGQHLLVAEAGGAAGAALPTPDAIGTTDLSATAGKVALVSSFVPLTGACPTGPKVVDLVGYGAAANCFEGAGPTPSPSNTLSATRKLAGCTDTGNNAADFQALAPSPRTTLSATTPCAPIPAGPALSATDPASPGDSTSPRVIGSAAGGTTVEIFTNATCTGTPVASGTAAQFASPGITASVPAGSTTSFHALAYDSLNTSACSSGSLTYVEAAATPTPPPPPTPASPGEAAAPTAAAVASIAGPSASVAQTSGQTATGTGRVVWRGSNYPNLKTVAKRTGVPIRNLAPYRTSRRHWIARVV